MERKERDEVGRVEGGLAWASAPWHAEQPDVPHRGSVGHVACAANGKRAHRQQQHVADMDEIVAEVPLSAGSRILI